MHYMSRSSSSRVLGSEGCGKATCWSLMIHQMKRAAYIVGQSCVSSAYRAADSLFPRLKGVDMVQGAVLLCKAQGREGI